MTEILCSLKKKASTPKITKLGWERPRLPISNPKILKLAFGKNGISGFSL